MSPRSRSLPGLCRSTCTRGNKLPRAPRRASPLLAGSHTAPRAPDFTYPAASRSALLPRSTPLAGGLTNIALSLVKPKEKAKTSHSLTANVVYNMVFQLFTTCLPILTTPYLTRTLGLSQSSVHSFVESIVTLFTVFGSVGTSLYGCRKIAYVRDDRVKLSQTAYEIIFLKLLLLIPVCGVYIPLFCISHEFSRYFLINLITVVSSGFEITWFFNGVEDFKLVTVRNFIVKILFVICLFAFIHKPSDLGKYIFLVCISDLLGNLSMWLLLPRYLLPLRQFHHFAIFKRLKESFALFIPQSASYLYSLADKAMLGTLTPNLDNVGIYDYAYRIVKMIVGLLQSMGYVLLSRISNLQASGDREGIKTYINKSADFTLLLGLPMAFGIVGIADTFVPLYLGEEFAEVSRVLVILSPLIFCTSFNSLLGVQLLLAVGKDKGYTAATVGGAVLNIALNFALIPRFGIYGATAASLLSEVTVLTVQFVLAREYISFGALLRRNGKIALAALVMFAFCLALGRLPVPAIARLALQLIVSVAVYFGALALLRERTFGEILAKVRGFLRRGKA